MIPEMAEKSPCKNCRQVGGLWYPCSRHQPRPLEAEPSAPPAPSYFPADEPTRLRDLMPEGLRSAPPAPGEGQPEPLAPLCGATKDKWVCNLAVGHSGDHQERHPTSGGCIGWASEPEPRWFVQREADREGFITVEWFNNKPSADALADAWRRQGYQRVQVWEHPASLPVPPRGEESPDPPHVREDYREVWASGYRAGRASLADLTREREEMFCGCRHYGDGTGTECTAHEERRIEAEQEIESLTAQLQEAQHGRCKRCGRPAAIIGHMLDSEGKPVHPEGHRYEPEESAAEKLSTLRSALEGLEGRWRSRIGPYGDAGMSHAYETCADELKALLVEGSARERGQ